MRALVSCLLLVAACATDEPPPASPDSPAPATGPGSLACDDAMTVRVLADGAVELAPDLGLGAARPAWRDDLNGDGLPDLALRFADACGNWGDCPYAVLATCGAERYAVVWGPEYCVELEVGGDGGEGWAELVAVDRVGDEGARRVWRFADGRYRRGALR